MKYIRTAISEQETTINVLYDEQLIKIYSSRAEVIKVLTHLLGNPTQKYKKNKTYWSGASWDIEFNNLKKIEKVFLFKSIIDSDIEIREKVKTKKKNVAKKETKTQNTKKKVSTKSQKIKKNSTNSKETSKKKKTSKKETNSKEKKNTDKTKKIVTDKKSKSTKKTTKNSVAKVKNGIKKSTRNKKKKEIDTKIYEQVSFI